MGDTGISVIETDGVDDNNIVKPFKNLQQLYQKLNNLNVWPEIVNLRENADFVYSGSEIMTKKVEKLSQFSRDQKPKTIVCHDMKGGYLEDRFIDGSFECDSYVFFHWSIIDTFIYFSHSFVTIPPFGWINAAHNHGVKILGTVITESTDGEHIWPEILSSLDETRKFANALVTLAKFYKFQGWLLNIENKIQPEHIENLLYFVQYLTTHIHNEIQDSEIIWYDSVTINGDLKWQNELNDKNQSFFENCDGIFLNYNWTESRLEASRLLAEKTLRIRDVYVGLDVWGRGCPGGGGFNSKTALEMIRKFDLSVAIFAPGWTHEFFGPKTFQRVERIFWAQLTMFTFIHVPIFDNEPFITSFCCGSGEKYYRNGTFDKIIPSFYNLSLQQFQSSIPSVHLKLISCETEEVMEKEKKLFRYTFQTDFEIFKIFKNQINFQEKLQQNNIENYFEFCSDVAFEGGSCLKFIINHPQMYNRLFLNYLEYDFDVLVEMTHRKEINENMMNNIDEEYTTSSSPILILSNNHLSKSIESFKDVELGDNWIQSLYYAKNIKTIHEIGLIFEKKGWYYLGKVEIKPIKSSL